MAEEKFEPVTGSTLVLFLIADFLLLCGAALFAGLTLSVMGLDTLSLEIIASASGAKEADRANAQKLLPMRRLGNKLLITLIIGNVAVNTLIAQITDRVVHGMVGAAISTAIITLGGEIIPQATMAAHALKVGAASVPIVKIFLYMFYPISAPLAWVLDRFVGTDPGQIYDRNELRKLMALHASRTQRSGLGQEDLSMMLGAMDLHDKRCVECMTPLVEVFMVEATDLVTESLIHEIWESGHSRIPVYRGTRNNVVGLLFAKDLLLMNRSADEERISVLDLCHFYPRMPLTAYADTKLIVLLGEFRQGKSHLALVKSPMQIGTGDPVYDTIGIVTLEDVVEELIRANIEDEFDVRAGDGTADGESGSGPPSPTAGGGGGANSSRRGGRALSANRSSNSLEQRWLGIQKEVLRGMRKTTLEESFRKVASMFLVESVAPFAGQDPQKIRSLFVHREHVYRIKAPSARARQLPMESKSNLWLYRKGVPTNFMTLIISGAIEIFMDDFGSNNAAGEADVDHDDANVEEKPLANMFANTTAASLSTGGKGGTTATATGGGANAMLESSVASLQLGPGYQGGHHHHGKLLPSRALPVMEMSQWTVIGVSVLGGSGGAQTMVPDFSARIVANSVLLLITSSQFKAMNQQQHHHQHHLQHGHHKYEK